MLAARIFGKVSPASGLVKVCRTVVVKLGGKKGSVGSRAPVEADDTVTVTNAYRAAIPTARSGKGETGADYQAKESLAGSGAKSQDPRVTHPPNPRPAHPTTHTLPADQADLTAGAQWNVAGHA